MNATHAKQSLRSRGLTMNAGLKTPCQCNSGKKFKHCCYNKATVGWGWFLLSADNLVPVAADLSRIDPDFKFPAILAHPTYKVADQYVQDGGLERQLGQLLIVRMEVEDLIAHIEKQYPAGSHLMVICPEDITADRQGAVYEIECGPKPEEPPVAPGVTAEEVAISQPILVDPSAPSTIV